MPISKFTNFLKMICFTFKLKFHKHDNYYTKWTPTDLSPNVIFKKIIPNVEHEVDRRKKHYSFAIQYICVNFFLISCFKCFRNCCQTFILYFKMACAITFFLFSKAEVFIHSPNLHGNFFTRFCWIKVETHK